MKQEVNANAPGTAAVLRLLLCDTTGEACGLPSSGVAWVSSPIRCLEMAVDRKPGLVAVRFGGVPIPERGLLVELAAALKRSRHTRKSRVLALLHEKHRELLEEVHLAGVDFVRYVEAIPLDPDRLREIVAELGPEDRPARYLHAMCPFLNYSGIDDRHELKLCRAYLDRMVLGGVRLHRVCETEAHRECPYFLNPRRGS